jgi:signal transduction histidine kinase/ligand-binding sensor domain-containing protein
MRAPIVVAVLASVFGQSLTGLSRDKLISQYSVTHWAQPGLDRTGSILSLLQDAQGYLVVGTPSGPLGFDGVRFVSRSFPSVQGAAAVTLASALAPDGSIWYGSASGLHHARDGQLRTFTREDGLPAQDINALRFDEAGNLWIGTGKGLAVVRPGGRIEAVAAFPRDSVWSIDTDGEGGLWVASFGTGLARLRGSQLTTFGVAQGLPTTNARTVYRARDGSVYVALTGSGVYVWRGQGFVPLLSSPVRAPLDVWTILEDRDGLIWLAAAADGVMRWDGHRFEVLTEAGRPLDAYALTLIEDSAGNLWAGSRTGLYRVRDDKVIVSGIAEGLPSSMIGPVMEYSPGLFLVGTRNQGALWWRGPGTKAVPVKGMESCKLIVIHRSRDGSIWFGTDRGLAQMRDGGVIWRTTAITPQSPFVFAIDEDSRGNLFVGNRMGICRWNGKTCEPEPQPPGDHDENSFDVLVARDGTLWGARGGGGICRLTGSAPRCWPIPRVSAGDVFDLHEDARGNVWAASMNGLVRIGTDDQLVLLTREQGIQADWIHSIIDSEDGFWWLTSNDGLFRVRESDLQDLADRRRSHVEGLKLSGFDGLRSAGAVAGAHPAGFKAADGAMWFSTNGGLVRVPPEVQGQSNHLLPVHLEEVRVDGILVSGSPLDLPAGARSVEIHYTAIDFAAPEGVRFRYQLAGFDRGWTDAGSRRVAYYNSLPPGSYRFQVQAASHDGVWGEAVKELPVRQLPQLWETWWFYLACAVLLAFGIALWNRNRIRQAERRFQAVLDERSRIARDLHDTLLGDFTGLTMQLGALLPTVSSTPAERSLERLVTRMEESLREARDAIQFLRLQDREHRPLSAVLREVGERVAGNSGLRFDLEIEGEERPLSFELRECALRVAMEAVRNAAKHSKGSDVKVRAVFDARQIAVEIQDNGRGFVETAPRDGPHYGIRGMRERAQQAGGQVRIETGEGQGTIVRLLLPAPELKSAGSIR